MRFKILGLLALLATGAALAGSWDSQFSRKVSVIMDGGQQLATITTSTNPLQTYVKVNCGNDTRIGVGTLGADGGIGSYACALSDGGNACDLYHFTLGEKFYANTVPGTNTVVLYTADGGSDTCDVFEGH